MYMKSTLGILILSGASGGIVAYAKYAYDNVWVLIGLFMIAGVGFELTVSDMIDTRVEKLRGELRGEFNNR